VIPSGIPTVLGGDTTGVRVGGSALAIAVFVSDPASISACVTAYVAVHVVLSSGANVVAGHVIADNEPVPLNELSLIDMPSNVTLPVFVTRNE
jgi:hypothetical protein